MNNDIPFIDLKSQYNDLEVIIKNRINRVLEHGQYIMGPEVFELEDKLSAFTNTKYCITVASGTEALLISLMALDIKSGDEVITTSFTFAATAEAIILSGGIPVFIDIDEETCNIDTQLIESKITERTRAIIPVSLFGQPAKMQAINSIAIKYGLAVIEDGAQSFGATYNQKRSCNLSAIGCTSFFPSKPLGGYGDGGAIFTNDDNIAQICREIRIHGQNRRYNHIRLGIGGRMDTIQCAIVLAKLERFTWEIKQRRLIGDYYNKTIDEMNIKRVQQKQNSTSVFAQYSIFINNRDKVKELLKGFGIPTSVHYPKPLHQQPAYLQFQPYDGTPVSSKISKSIICLPMSPYLDRSQQNTILEKLSEVISV